VLVSAAFLFLATTAGRVGLMMLYYDLSGSDFGPSSHVARVLVGWTIFVGGILALPGLIGITRRDGRWRAGPPGHAGISVAYAAEDPRTGTLWAALDHGHWGPKLSRSTDGGRSWADVRVLRRSRRRRPATRPTLGWGLAASRRIPRATMREPKAAGRSPCPARSRATPSGRPIRSW